MIGNIETPKADGNHSYTSCNSFLTIGNIETSKGDGNVNLVKHFFHADNWKYRDHARRRRFFI